MKYLALFLIVVLACSSIDAKVRRHRTHRTDKTNNYYQFLVGAVTALGGADNNVEQCLSFIPGWEALPLAEAASADSMEKSADASQTGTFDTILKYLGAAIDICCTVKNTLKSFFAAKRLRWIRRNRRLFAQGKRMRRFTWSFGGAWNAVTGAVSSAVDAAHTAISGAYGDFKAGLASLKNKVIDGIDWAVATATVVADYVKKK